MLKLAPSPQKGKQLPYMAIVVASNKKGNVVHTRQVKFIKKQQLATLKNHFLKSFPTTATLFFQLPTHPTTGEVYHQYLQTIRNRRSFLSKLNNFSLCRKRRASNLEPKSLLMILRSLQFTLFCVQKMILYQIVVRISEKLFLLMTICTSLMKRTSLPM